MKTKRKNKTKVSASDILTASRCGEFDANKDIVNRTRTNVYKSKKTYTRKEKHAGGSW